MLSIVAAIREGARKMDMDVITKLHGVYLDMCRKIKDKDVVFEHDKYDCYYLRIKNFDCDNDKRINDIVKYLLDLNINLGEEQIKKKSRKIYKFYCREIDNSDRRDPNKKDTGIYFTVSVKMDGIVFMFNSLYNIMMMKNNNESITIYRKFGDREYILRDIDNENINKMYERNNNNVLIKYIRDRMIEGDGESIFKFVYSNIL